MSKPNIIKIDDIEYVRKDSQVEYPESNYRIVRSDRGGVFAGYLESIDYETKTAILKNARRIWYWEGAASLSQLAVDGTSKPENCKFPTPVDVEMLGVIEILKVTETAKKSIESVGTWKK